MTRFLFMVVLICVGTSQPTRLATLRSSFDEGIFGYTGHIESFKDPITLRYREVPFFKTTVEMITHSEINRSIAEMTFVFSGSIRKSDDQLIWDTAIEQMSIDGREVQSKAPLMTILMITTDRGLVKALRYDLSGLQELGVIAKPNELERIKNIANHFTKIFPERPIEMDGEIYDAETLLLSSLGFLPDDISPKINVLTTRVMGITSSRMRRHIVAQLIGDIVLEGKAGDKLNAAIKGHYLIDIESGLLTSGMVGITLRYHQGNEIATYYVKYHTETTEIVENSRHNKIEKQDSVYPTSPMKDIGEHLPQEDPVSKLRKLKQMLEEGLISQEDYEKNKRIILDQM